jgi:hypothetical protein
VTFTPALLKDLGTRPDAAALRVPMPLAVRDPDIVQTLIAAHGRRGPKLIVAG